MAAIIGTFFRRCRGGNSVFVQECEFAVSSSDEERVVIRRRLLSALVLSKRREDLQCGITILEGSLPSISNPTEKREEMYLLAVGYYRNGDFSRSRDLVDGCLEIAPGWWKALLLKNIIEDRVWAHQVKGIVSTVLIVARVLECTTKSSYPTLGFEAITFRNLIEDRVKVVASPLPSTGNPLQMNEELYILAHRYYTRGKYSRSRHLIDCCLELAPEWRPAISLKRSIEFHIKKDKVIGVVTGIVCGAAVLAVGFLGGFTLGIVAYIARYHDQITEAFE